MSEATKESVERAERYLAGCDDGCGCDFDALAAEFDAVQLALLGKFKKCVEDAHSAGDVLDWLRGQEAELESKAGVKWEPETRESTK